MTVRLLIKRPHPLHADESDRGRANHASAAWGKQQEAVPELAGSLVAPLSFAGLKGRPRGLVDAIRISSSGAVTIVVDNDNG